MGVVRRVKGTLKTWRGRQLPVTVLPSADADVVREAATRKQLAHRHIEPGAYVLLYPSFAVVNTLPGSDVAFTVKGYAKDTGRNYKRIVLYLCSREDFCSKLKHA